MHKPLNQLHPDEQSLVFSNKLSPKYSFSSPFSLIRSPLECSTFFPCQHDSFIQQSTEDYGNCKDCGVYLNKTINVFGLKTKKNAFHLDFTTKPILDNFLRNLPKKPLLSPSSNYLKNRASLIDWIFEMAKKLDLSLNTAHLSISYLDQIMAIQDQCPMHLVSSTCLLLAAKAVELDERIPYIPKLKKLVAPIYSPDDFKRCEREVLALLDWRLQIATFFDILEFYMSQGLIFNSDEVNGEEIQQNYNKSPSPTGNISLKEQKFSSPFNNEKNMSFLGNSAGSGSTGIQFYGRIGNERKIYEVITAMEKDLIKLANFVVKDLGYYEIDMKKLAAASVAFLRKINNITPIWNKDLENISGGIQMIDIQEILDLYLCNKFITYFDSFSFQSRQETLLRDFQNLKLNKENSANIPLILKKATTFEEQSNKSFEHPTGFQGYLRAYTLGLEPDPSMKTNLGIKRSFPSVYSKNSLGGVYNNYGRSYEEYLQGNYILKDAENKMNIYNNNGINGNKTYFQEKNSNSYSDINLLSKKIDDIYGKIFTNHATVPLKKNNIC